ncbi:BMP family ABC transporter substrate-binding protein [Halobacteria archaeon AArc-dxtr1]|nr:BMP family ABC transporter substrate-binding protein [Halobacteria archaeon AArc-dxtr1]
MSRRTDARNGSADSNSTTTSVDRRTVLRTGAASAAAISGMALAGCIGGGGDGDQVAIISSPAGFGDQAFNDNARSGLEEAADDFGFELNDVEATDETEYESQQADLAETEDYDLIVMVGEQHLDPLETNADEYPDQYWMLINNHVEGADNVSGWIEMNNEMSFLAGVAAATLTHEDISENDSETDPDESIVGFAGGEDIPLINAFEESYKEGVEWVDSDIEVLDGYGGSFSDPDGVNNVAESQFDEGADIVWHAAAAAGAGAFSAAQDNGRFALGVDDDQSVSSEEYSDVILGSAIKALNQATYDVAEAVYEDDWDSMSGEQNLSLENEGIDFITGQDFEDVDLGDLDDNIQQAKDEFAEGEIELSCGPTSC